MSVKESLTSNGVNSSSVLFLLFFIGCSNIQLYMISMFSTIVTDREFTRFTVLCIKFARMSHTDLLCWDEVFITV